MSLGDLLRPPSDEIVERDVRAFAQALSRRYGASLRGIFMFGSRARGDNRPDSDVDLAVVVDSVPTDWRERGALSDLSYDFLVNDAVDIQAWPISADVWNNPALHSNPAFVQSMKRDARSIEL
jgi:antitoxin ChpS